MFNVNHSFISRYGNHNRKKRYTYVMDNGSNDLADHLKIQKGEENKKLNSLNNLCVGQKRNDNISKATVRKIRNRVWYLNQIAEEKEKIVKNGNRIKFKLSFITLTISGEDWGGVTQANKKLLNTLLTDLRRNCNMLNYVWRLEHQQNGKIHYHIITDASINYKYLRHVWNRIQEEQGYMDSFTEKFSNMSYTQYVNYYVKLLGVKADLGKLPKWYAQGCREGWKNPNSVDVRMINDDKQINYYISKYISKDQERQEGAIKDRIDLSGRVWGSSSELAKCEHITPFIQDLGEFAYWASIEHTPEQEVQTMWCSYVLVDWKVIFSYFPWLKIEFKKRLTKFCDLKPSTPPKLGLFTFD